MYPAGGKLFLFGGWDGKVRCGGGGDGGGGGGGGGSGSWGEGEGGEELEFTSPEALFGMLWLATNNHTCNDYRHSMPISPHINLPIAHCLPVSLSVLLRTT